MGVGEEQLCSIVEGALQETFQTMLGDTISIVRKEGVAAEQDKLKNLDVLSVVGIKSSKYVGSLCMGFPKATFVKIVERLLGEAIHEINNENSDAAGELLNIIYCAARNKINLKGFDLQPAIPATVIGSNLAMTITTSGVYYVTRVSGVLGDLELSLSLRQLHRVENG
jgi:CheY-specific phosphatase CheX